jgi:thiamine transport system permease protein
VFLFCFFSFIIVLLFGAVGTTTLEVEIYHAARSAVNAQAASALAVTETALAMGVMFLISRLQKIADKTYGAYSPRKSGQKKLSGIPEKAAFGGLSALIALFLIAPLASIALRGLRPSSFLPLFRSAGFHRALFTTLRTSLFSALLATAAAFAYCALFSSGDFWAGGKSRSRTLSRALPLLPFAVSSVVMGFGVMRLVQRGSEGIYIIARASLMWTLAFKQISSSIDSIPPEVIHASRILSPSPLDAVFRVILPQTRRAVASAFAFCFAAAASDASLPLMLVIPRFDTLALYTYRLAGSYRLNQASGAGCVIVLLTVAVFALADAASSPRRSFFRGRQI